MSSNRDEATRPTTGQTFDDVSWEYEPEDEDRVLLVPAGQFFEEIPWEGADEL